MNQSIEASAALPAIPAATAELLKELLHAPPPGGPTNAPQASWSRVVLALVVAAFFLWSHHESLRRLEEAQQAFSARLERVEADSSEVRRSLVELRQLLTGARP